jgi:hypothetical protein
MDAMAVIYARELTRWGIETSIIVPGAFTTGTNHFAHSGRPADEARVAEYEAGPNKGLGEKILEAFGAIVPPDADASAVAEAIVKVVYLPFGKRPFRVHIDPTQDGADVSFAVMDRVRSEMPHRLGLGDLLVPAQRRAFAPGVGGGAQRIADRAIQDPLQPVCLHVGQAARGDDTEGTHAGRASVGSWI